MSAVQEVVTQAPAVEAVPKRAMTLGYTRVSWYPEGVDGWVAHGLPTEMREPVPRPDATE